ncbi:uncharacterized protein LOC129312457 [Prosopis cineraria]|uniref:uncharacterized protein LOC129312457 n=1 Tax=Prosopis cineraria TaxID=364024 RepID=UPI00240F0D26|nr:uncharacterized protein LOC129312457 [Prosopis cineraria]
MPHQQDEALTSDQITESCEYVINGRGKDIVLYKDDPINGNNITEMIGQDYIYDSNTKSSMTWDPMECEYEGTSHANNNKDPYDQRRHHPCVHVNNDSPSTEEQPTLKKRWLMEDNHVISGSISVNQEQDSLVSSKEDLHSKFLPLQEIEYKSKAQIMVIQPSSRENEELVQIRKPGMNMTQQKDKASTNDQITKNFENVINGKGKDMLLDRDDPINDNNITEMTGQDNKYDSNGNMTWDPMEWEEYEATSHDHINNNKDQHEQRRDHPWFLCFHLFTFVASLCSSS